MKYSFASLLVLFLFASTLAADEPVPELKQLQGHWQVVELSEDGMVVPTEAIPTWLASGGVIEIADNAIIVTSIHDGQKSVKLFSVDATQYPHGLDIFDKKMVDQKGIYRFDGDKLIVCLSDEENGPRPTEFSAPTGSKRMLMVLKKTTKELAGAAKFASLPPKMAATPDVAEKVLTDAEVSRMLIGTWRFEDDAGALITTLAADGTWSSIREMKELRLFQKVFVRTPVSRGQWKVVNGILSFHCLGSIYPERVNQVLPFTIRSVSNTDFIFVDFMGRLGRATKVQAQ